MSYIAKTKIPFYYSIFEEKLDLYPDSMKYAGNDMVALAEGEHGDLLIVSGATGHLFEGHSYQNLGEEWVKAPLTSTNAAVLRKLFPFTAPVRVLGRNRTIGLGDRLGIATPGHIRALLAYDEPDCFHPVLAQQSPRELNLTGRSFADVLDAATFAVFREGFTRGYGADGDHLKTKEDIAGALSLGYTMITLDCSDHIRKDADTMSDTDVAAVCGLPDDVAQFYSGKTFLLDNASGIADGSSPGGNTDEVSVSGTNCSTPEAHGDTSISFTLEQLRRIYLKYGNAIKFAADIYSSLIAPCKDQTDFEISLDETDTPTLPSEHFFVVSELVRLGVRFETIAPRFCGEFQKGVDYVGDISQFEAELHTHDCIARHFGYKLSIHSGSDKFSVFNIIGKVTDGRFHLKTSGTSWLEAMQLIAEKSPGLYREIHSFALANFEAAKRNYHITADISLIPDVNALPDSGLTTLFTLSEARQLIHITYGKILTARQEDGESLFNDKLRSLWSSNDNAYAGMLIEHIGKHLEELIN